MFNKKAAEPSQVPIILIAAFFVFFVLYIGASFIIPFIIALLFSFAIIWTSHFYQKLKLPTFVAMILSLSTYAVIFWLIWELINSNIQDLIEKLPEYQSKIGNIISTFFQATHIPEPKSISQIVENLDLSKIFTLVFWALTSIFSSTGIIFFYTLFILLEYRYFHDKLILSITNEEKRTSIRETIIKIKTDTKAYFIIKTTVSLITAWLSYIVMLMFSLDFAIFWAFLIFILNFIPSVGSIIALIFPISIALIQEDISFIAFTMITGWLVWIQVLMWNIIEPKFMWNRLNLSPLVIIISLSFWWALWWVVWMLLSVPIMVIINIILAKIPSTRPVAVLLSEKWDLNIESDVKVTKAREQIIRKIMKKIK